MVYSLSCFYLRPTRHFPVLLFFQQGTTMSSSIKKEVSCKVSVTVFNAAREKNIDLSNLITEVPYYIYYLCNKHERIKWNI